MAAMCSRFRLTATPPFRPASRASLESNSCAVPLACAAFPPLLAISFCLSRSIDANPRLLRVRTLPPPSLSASRRPPRSATPIPPGLRSSFLLGMPHSPEEVGFLSVSVARHDLAQNGVTRLRPGGARANLEFDLSANGGPDRNASHRSAYST